MEGGLTKVYGDACRSTICAYSNEALAEVSIYLIFSAQFWNFLCWPRINIYVGKFTISAIGPLQEHSYIVW